MRTTNLVISMVSAACLTGALLAPGIASADRGGDDDGWKRYEHRDHYKDGHRYWRDGHHNHKKEVRVIREHRYEPYRRDHRHHRHDRPVVVYRDAPVRLYPGNEISIIYRGGW